MTSKLFTRRQKRTRFKLTSHAYGRPRLECVLAGQWRRAAFDGV